MRCVEPLGHGQVIGGLWAAAREGRLAHALCFSGPAGSGKFLAAEWLALGLLCASGPGRPCGTCGPCKRARAGTHPDVMVLDPEEEGDEEIKLHRITPRADGSEANVSEFLSLKPMEGGWRVVLVRSADRANEEAQNALLKTLEEPGDDVLIVLTTARPDLLLPTIHSRCVRVRLDAPGDDVTRAALAREAVPAAVAEACARWSRGAPGEALELARSAAPELRALLVGVWSGELGVVEALAAYAEVDGDYPGRTPAAAARSKARALIDLALDLGADLRRGVHGVDAAHLAHGDLGRPAWVPSELRLERQLEECLLARQDVDLNLAPEAAVERVLLALEPRIPVRRQVPR